MSFHSLLATYLKHLFVVFLIKSDDDFENMYITDEIPLLRFTPHAPTIQLPPLLSFPYHLFVLEAFQFIAL